MSNNKTLNNLPNEMLRNFMKYMTAEDLFTFGQVNNKFRENVINYCTHPLSTKMQYLKTRKNWYYKEKTVYDLPNGLSMFKNVRKTMCKNDSCECKLYRQRKDWTIIDIFYCPCSEYGDKPSTCSECCMLMHEILNIQCESCLDGMQQCKNCQNDLDN